LRVYGRHEEDVSKPITERVLVLRRKERSAGLLDLRTYACFGARVAAAKCDLLRFLMEQRHSGKTVVGYGAPAKASTLLNYCGIGPELLAYTVDLNPKKQGRWLPGSRVPIFSPDRIAATRPDFVLILPWNLRHEISQQISFVRDWGGQFVVPIPRVEVF
jgi:hypothetical protein